MPRRRRLSTVASALAVAAGLTASGAAAAQPATACAYRNAATGAVPFVLHVTTNLTPAAARGDVCATADAAVARVQGLGYDLGGARTVAAGGSWALAHRLVRPPGWPRPAGPPYDPHLRVVLRLLPGAAARPAGAAGSYWISFDEYT